jgi:hypothetical protein
VSPWSNVGSRASTVGAVAIAWLIIIGIIASAFGGYLTGRLRTKWTLVHTDEVFFRDTANGFLSWAVALVASVALMASAAASMAGSVAEGRSSQDGSAVATIIDPNLYFTDALFRSDHTGSESADTASRMEVGRILAYGAKQGQIPSADQNYLSRLVAARTGLSQPEAAKRVSDVMNDARQAADAARQATAHLLLWLFLSLLMGAFSASYAATIGGRQRDHVRTV